MQRCMTTVSSTGHLRWQLTAQRAAFSARPVARQPRQVQRLQAVSTKAVVPALQNLPWLGTSDQVQALEELRSRLSVSAYKEVSDDVLKWYLRDRAFDVSEAERKLTKMLRWRNELRPEKITKESIQQEFATGKSYVHSYRDQYGRPVMVINAAKHIIGQFSIDDSKRLCVFMLDSALKMLPEGGEQIICIVDLRGFGPSNADLEFCKFMVDAFFEYYPKRLGQVLMVDAPWVFQPLWKILQPLLRKYAALVRFVSVKEVRDEYFTPETAPPEFR